MSTPSPPDAAPGGRPAQGESGEATGLTRPDSPADGGLHPIDSPPDTVGPYVIDGEIGRGGAGVVYRAHDRRDGKVVAIKSIRGGGETRAADLVRRFEREARLLAWADHPGIAAILGIEETEKGLYLVLEYVPGRSLASRLAEGPLGVAETLRVVARIAAAVEAAHERRIIHRDLKPANVQLGEGGEVKVLDFGLAKAVWQPTPVPRHGAADPVADLTNEGILVGTVSYMSPEQARGEELDTRTDVWSLGCVLYECLSGRRTWGEGAIAARLRAIEEEPFDRSWLPAETPARIQALLERMLEKGRGQRIDDMAEVRTELERALVERDGITGSSGLAAVRHGNLPRQLTRFVGRRAEERELSRMLASPGVVTLVGPGGAGKTRLALAVAEAIHEAYPDGTWVVDLAAVAAADRPDDDRAVARAVARALGVEERPGGRLAEAIAVRVRGRRLLVVLDSCEHVCAAAGAMALQIVRAALPLPVLATSREALGVVGERVLAVSPLETPDPERLPALADLATNEAVALFVERARAADPSFALNADTAAAVARVCRQLDGLPLALELGAARLRSMSVGELAAGLEKRFDLLSCGSRLLPERQQTLRALIGWSHDQLEGRDRALLRRLGVFSGGFTLEAAEAVAGFGEMAETEVLPGLRVLLERSLVTAVRRGAQMRYRLLESVRAYALERLIEAGEAGPSRERHLEHHLRLAALAAPRLRGATQGLWLDRLAEEHDNLHAAIRHAIGSPATAGDGLELATHLGDYWVWRSHMAEGVELLRGALAVAAVSARGRVRGLFEMARLQVQLQDAAAARETIPEVLALARQAGDETGTAEAINLSGQIALFESDLPSARRLFAESRAIFARAGDSEGEARTAQNLGSVAARSGDVPASIALRQEFIAVERRLGNLAQVAMGLTNLAAAVVESGDPEAALGLHREALAIRRRLGDERNAGMCLNNLAAACYLLGREEEMVGYLEEALATFRRLGYLEGIATIVNNLGCLAMGRGALAEARRDFGECLGLLRRSGTWMLLAGLLENLARVEIDSHRPERAATLLGAAGRERQTTGRARPEFGRAELEACIAAARGALADTGYDEAFARGAALDREAAVAYGLEESHVPLDEEQGRG